MSKERGWIPGIQSLDYVPDPNDITPDGLKTLRSRHPHLRFPNRNDKTLPTVEEIHAALSTNSAHDIFLNTLSFGDDLESFFIACGYIFGDNKTAVSVTKHEVKHARELSRYGIPYSFEMLFAKDQQGILQCFTAVKSHYPENLSENERSQIVSDVLDAVDDPSEEDLIMMTSKS